jgi:hypothetical protein
LIIIFEFVLCPLAAGNSFAHVYDPKNGENVSNFIGKEFVFLRKQLNSFVFI